MPALVYPPGQIPAYSNYGATLAGHIVEQISGEPYDQYIEEHILKPLGMTHSSMRQPLPADLASAMSQSYTFNGEFQELPLIFCTSEPGRRLSASGADMGKFMLAHLQGGEYNGGRILQARDGALDALAVLRLRPGPDGHRPRLCRMEDQRAAP